MARYIDADKIDFRIPYYPDEDSSDALVSLKTVKRCIAMTPTEDVLSKGEVASEVFEEIRGLFNNFLNDKISFYEFMETWAKLEKKYTEE